MLLFELQNDLKAALKRGDSLSVSVLRMLQSALHNKSLEKRAKLAKAGGIPGDATLTDEEVVGTIRSEAKRRREAAGEFDKGSRPELARKELDEAKILEAYLPAEPDDATIEDAVREVMAEVGNDPKQFGKVMGAVMKRLPGVSGERMSRVVKNLLGAQ
ncbi:MAG: GatB/YqeY domain-containing protein [Candidatus Sungbacteria bacterium]|nr:GatB/YqeY domain-containing protein [Candidatus Sungbacteria bacterium]